VVIVDWHVILLYILNDFRPEHDGGGALQERLRGFISELQLGQLRGAAIYLSGLLYGH
jgi:hypothetical protein